MTRVTAALAALALTGCVVASHETEVPEGNWLLPGTTWKLVELNGEPFTAQATATLTPEGRVTGQAPCNAFNATYVGHWPDLRFNAVARTKMACPELAQETAFFAALNKVTHAEMLSDSMLLTGPDKTALRLIRG